MINLDRGGYRFSGPDDRVQFDLNGDGKPDTANWTARGTTIAFLALDRNGNGVIDDGRELFGSATLGRNGATAPNGFWALADLDSNMDGVVDSKDDAWKRLLLWIDENHDGVSQPNELHPISSSSVTAIDTSYHWSGRVDIYGNQFRDEGRAIVNGKPTSIYDVWFVTGK